MTGSAASADWIQLAPDERVAWRGRPSARTLAGDLLPGALLVALGVAAGVALALGVTDATFPRWTWLLPPALIVVGAALAALPALRWRSTHYVITSNEVYKREGLISESVEQLRLDRVQNTSYSQSAGQRLLGYGDVVIHTAGSGGTRPEIVFDDVPDPAEVHRILSAQLDGGSRP